MRSLEEKLEFKKKMEERTANFAVAVFRCIDSLPQLTSSRVIAFQLGKSASSIGANYREANRSESLDDFVHKIGITLKECSESLYWLDLLLRLYSDECCYRKLAKECDELLRIFQSIRTKMYARRKKVDRD